MSYETGIVVEKTGATVRVEAEAHHACASCAARHNCIPGGEMKKRSLVMNNSIGAEPGDYVEFMVQEKSVVTSSLILYLFPVLALISGSALGLSMDHILHVDKDLSAGIFGLGAFLLSFVIIRLITPLITGRTSFMPELTRKISEEEYCNSLNM
ncbi:MAG TPA: SoxR reducing system RseC family protein [Spirochaetota bacterium]|nr:SoxR reducing system RseC family protein [Spirochaetota bacterium]HPJ36913.1 SoxR reducing system RseC family protein [Spirochaetota bacterium]HPQ54091.1 SoxR reducing system RseC family protein [Spirochaetota bacterium]